MAGEKKIWIELLHYEHSRRLNICLHKQYLWWNFFNVCVFCCSVLSDSLRSHGCSPPGSSVHGDSPGKNSGVSCHALLQGIFPTQGSNLGLSHCRRILYPLNHHVLPSYLIKMMKVTMFSSNIFIVLLLTIRAAIHLIILLSELGELGELGSRSSFSLLSIKWDICKNTYHLLMNYVCPGGSDGEESACNAGDLGSIPGLGRFPGEGKSYTLQYSCLKNSMDRGGWRATLSGVAKESDTTDWLSLSCLRSQITWLYIYTYVYKADIWNSVP